MADSQPEMSEDDHNESSGEADRRKFQLEMKHLMETSMPQSPSLSVC